MNETQYHQMADAALEQIAEMLEKPDAKGMIELEVQGGIVTIELDDGKQFIVSKHAPSKQIWLSSPLSGGLHFSYDNAHQDWRLADQRSLQPLLLAELKQLAGVEV